MTTTTLDLKVTADARSAVSGLKPLQTSLTNVTKDADKAESALKDLDKSHKIGLNDKAIETAKNEISKLRNQMRHDLSIDASANTKPAQAKIRQLQSAIRTLDAETIDIKAEIDVDSSGMEAAESAASRAGGSFLGTAGGIAAMSGKLGSLVKFAGPVAAVGTAFAGIGIGAVKVLGPMIGLADKMENAHIAFEQFLGSGDAADAFLSNLQQFAAQTPFEFPELVDSSKKLLAFGIKGEDVIGTMTTLGDAAALTGADVGDLATIWGQMAAKGKVSNEELLQLTENGIPAYDALAKSMGKTPAEIQKMAEKGELLSGTTLPKLKAGLDSTFGGGMAKQAQTLSGKWSTFKDTLTGIGTDLGTVFLPFVKGIVDQLQPALDHLAEWVSAHKGDLAEGITSGAATVLDFGAGLTDVWASVITAIGNVIEWAGRMTVSFGQAGQALSNLPGVPDDLGDSAVAAGEDIIGMGKDAQSAGDFMHGSADNMRSAADNIRESGKKMAEGFAVDQVKKNITAIKTEIASLKKKPPSPEIDAKIEKAREKLKTLRADLKATTTAKHETVLDAKISSGRKKLAEWRSSLAYLRTLKPTTEVKAKIAAAKQKVAEFKKLVQDAVKKRTAPIDAKITNAKKKAGDIKKTLANLGKKKSTAKVDAKTADAKKKLKAVNTQISNLKKKKAAVSVSVKTGTTKKALKVLVDTRRTAKIGVISPKAKNVKSTIDKVASKKRTASINTDVKGESQTRSTIDNLAKDRYTTIHVTTVHSGGGGGGGGGGGEASTQSLVPQLFGTDTATVAGLRAASLAAPQMVGVTSGGQDTVYNRNGGTVTQLAPRQTPVKIYLDGAEIADRLTLKAGRLATSTSVRRRTA